MAGTEESWATSRKENYSWLGQTVYLEIQYWRKPSMLKNILGRDSVLDLSNCKWRHWARESPGRKTSRDPGNRKEACKDSDGTCKIHLAAYVVGFLESQARRGGKLPPTPLYRLSLLCRSGILSNTVPTTRSRAGIPRNTARTMFCLQKHLQILLPRGIWFISGAQLAILVSRADTEKEHFLQNPAPVRLSFLVWLCHLLHQHFK